MAACLSLVFAAAHGACLKGPPIKWTPPPAPGAWPRFLFHFRGAHGDFRLQEVRAVAEMLGFASQLELQALPHLSESASSRPAACSTQQYARIDGGDVGPSVFQWVSLPDASAAAAVASRCVLVRAAYDVWAHACFDGEGEPPSSRGRWEWLASAVCESGEAQRDRMLAPLGEESWKLELLTFGVHKPYSLAAKVALFELFHELLVGLPGEVELASPRHVITLLEDRAHPTALGPASGGLPPIEWEGWQGVDASGAPHEATGHSSRLFVGRRLSRGAGSLLAAFSLSSRRFVGRTSLPADLAFLMANSARVRRGSLVLDPFCGTASTLLSCARFGACVVGVDIDARTLGCVEAEGGGRAERGVYANFEQAGLPPPVELIVSDAGLLLHDQILTDGRYYEFDAIVTDPPYGLLEGLGALYVPLSLRIETLMAIAAHRLRVGGLLVFLLPVPAEDKEPTLPHSDCMELVSLSRQPMTLRIHRYLVTMRKTTRPSDNDIRAPSCAETPSELQKMASPWERWWESLGQDRATIDSINSKASTNTA
ncbi:hypothetical protein AB1Y20_020985 [Prymnesium parvum]|uniref:Ribosomal RNA large subunit methyltransferase K/L-like methyltransferase domain-containing protein n=1 Tax=Prymnesium parvum TaxID=97485 RepID=A0AB34JK06_PRYPA